MTYKEYKRNIKLSILLGKKLETNVSRIYFFLSNLKEKGYFSPPKLYGDVVLIRYKYSNNYESFRMVYLVGQKLPSDYISTSAELDHDLGSMIFEGSLRDKNLDVCVVDFMKGFLEDEFNICDGMVLDHEQIKPLINYDF